jgi:triphosphoribosyl-dephospho-CoA synthetase
VAGEHSSPLQEFIGAAAVVASFTEICASPKPGLVGPDGSGSHGDMDCALFLTSASVLAPYWGMQAAEGLNYRRGGEAALFGKLRERGLEMESAMFGATGGVNTHKGLIFALSVLAGAVGACVSEKDSGWTRNYDEALQKAAAIASRGVEDDFRRAAEKSARGLTLTHGERIYIERGVGGVRGEAARGFPSARAGAAAYERAISRGADANGAALSALLEIMALCEDTNVIHRAGYDFWRGEYMERVREASGRFDPASRDYGPLSELGEFLTERSASPGGAADLLVCSLFLRAVCADDGV